VVAKAPKYAEGYYYVGNVLKELGRYEEALVAYDKAIKLNPKNGACYYNRAIILYALGKGTKALEALEKSIEVQHMVGIYYSCNALSAFGKRSAEFREQITKKTNQRK
jgi:tetratricopeptide (TPR) repeat protein